MKTFLLRTRNFLAATVSAYVLAVVASTQFVLARLVELGPTISIGQRLSVTAHDLLGMAMTFLPLLCIGFLIALPVAALLTRWLSGARWLLFVAAGATTVAMIHILLEVPFGITMIAGARGAAGLAIQILAGAAGGAVYARLSRPTEPK